MKKPLKITLISILSIVSIFIIAVLIAVWIVFTPKKLTPIVSDILQKNIKCHSSLDNVELTFFSTFPNFDIKVNKLMLKNPQNSKVSDTLLYVESFYAKVNPIKFLFDKTLIISEINLKNGFTNLYSDSLGRGNFDIFITDSTKKDSSSFKIPFDFIDLKQMNIKGVRLFYLDEKNHISTNMDNINLSVAGELEQLNGQIDLKLSTDRLVFMLKDLSVSSSQIALNINSNKKENVISTDIYSKLEKLNVTKQADTFVENRDVILNLPLKANLFTLLMEIKKGSFIDFANNRLEFNGDMKKRANGLSVNLAYRTNHLNISEILALLPNNLKTAFSTMNIDGDASIDGEIKGEMYEATMPSILVNLNLKNGKYSQKSLPLALRDINGCVQANINLSDKAVSDLLINHVRLKSGNSSIALNGRIDDLMNSMLFNLKINGDIDLEDSKPFLSKNIAADGHLKANLKTYFSLNDITKINLKKIRLNGTINTQKLNLSYNDSTFVSLPNGDITIAIPSKKVNNKFNELISIAIDNASEIDFRMINSMQANIKTPKLDIGLSNLLDDKQPLSIRCFYDTDNLNVKMDTILADIANPKGTFYMTPYVKNNKINTLALGIESKQLALDYGKKLNLKASDSNIDGNITYDNKQKNIFLQFLPNIKAKINHIEIASNEVKTEAKIPVIDFHLTPEKLIINNSRFVVKKSDFNLSGVVSNISEYMKNEDMLTANLDFTSDMVDVYELMDLVSGFGAKDSVQKQAVAEKPQDGTKEPFMVPWNIDVILNTKVSHGKISDTDIYNLGGKLMIKDGVLVLEQMGFTCEAAKMQLTAIYRSERKNHLFAGVDFHLLDVEIDKLIKMIPQIDTIVPMLKYFKGKGEFHLAAETYLKSNYDIKYSTLRGASAIEGQNLVLLDNNTFNKLSKMLLFRKKTQNVIDSLSVELTVFKNEVELFPFLIAMDKYKVVMQGIYNLSQNYKIKAETISPIKIGVDLTSSPKGGLKLEKLKLLNLQYGNLFKPSKRNVTQQQVIELKKMISDALKANVKPQ